MAQLTIKVKDDEAERVLKAFETAESLGEKIADLSEIVEELKQIVKSQVLEGDSIAGED